MPPEDTLLSVSLFFQLKYYISFMECKINDFELVKEILFKPDDKSTITQIEDEIKIIDELIKNIWKSY